MTNNEKQTETTKNNKECKKSLMTSALAGAVGGAITFGFMSFVHHFLPSQKTSAAIQEFAMVDTGKIIRDRAASLAEQNYTKDEIYKDQVDFIRYLDDAMNGVSEERRAILLKPEALAMFRLPDYTQEVIRRIKLQESRLRREKK